MRNQSKRIFVCHCHDVTFADVTRCWKNGVRHPEEIKRVTGITMGDCQGKLCMGAFSETLAQLSGEPAERFRMPRTRPPLYPVRMGALAGLENNDVAAEEANVS